MNNLWESMQQHNRDQAIYRLAMDYAADYIGKREQGPAFPSARALDALGRFDEALPAQPAPAEQVLQMLHEDRLPGDNGFGRRTLLWLCQWRRDSGGAGSEAAGRCLGSKRRFTGDVTNCGQAGASLRSLVS